MKTYALTAWLLGAMAHASPERLGGFELKSCAKRRCLRVVAEEARRSPLDSAYVFGATHVEVFAQTETGGLVLKKQMSAASGSYDPDLGFVILRGAMDAFVNLEDGQLHTLSRVSRAPTR